MDDECHQSFLGWVESYRSSGPAGPDTAEDELRMCPLLWCRRSFGSKELAVRHVLDCPYLSNGWYWCPYHKRPERFLECNKQCESSSLRFRDKDSKLCLADKFLHWICRRRSWKRPGVYAASSSLQYMKTNKLVLQKPNWKRGFHAIHLARLR